MTRRLQLGQTLIESLVTILLIAAGVIALVRFQSYLAYDNSLIQQRADATILANNRIESLRDFQVLNNTTGYTSYASIASGSSTTTVTNTTYTVTWTVTTNTNPDYKTISVTVSWTDRRSSSQSINLVSRVAGVNPANSATIM